MQDIHAVQADPDQHTKQAERFKKFIFPKRFLSYIFDPN